MASINAPTSIIEEPSTPSWYAAKASSPSKTLPTEVRNRVPITRYCVHAKSFSMCRMVLSIQSAEGTRKIAKARRSLGV